MDRTEVYKKICKSLCAYYREGKEDIGKCFPVKVFTVNNLAFHDVKKEGMPERILEGIFCKNCEFYPDDCDFHLNEGCKEPCGGYYYFYLLIKEGILTSDDVTKLCCPCKECNPQKA